MASRRGIYRHWRCRSALSRAGRGYVCTRGRHRVSFVLGSLPVTSAPEASPEASPQVTTTPVCFVVHSPSDPSLPAAGPPAAVRGTRFQAADSDPSRVIVLVHGINSWSKVWDFSPSFSIARNLAREGFLVFSYDYLGAGESTYAYPLRATLTVGEEQATLHEIIEQVRGASVLRAGEANPCHGSKDLGVGTAPKVALIGHSGGAGLTEGYAGLYHGNDPGRVDAEVLASIAICLIPSSPCVQTYLQKAAVNQGQEVSFFLDDGSYQPYLGARGVLAQPCRPAFLLCVGATISGGVSPPSGQCQTNIDLLLWPQATPKQANLAAVCDPANWETLPTVQWDTEGLPGNLPLGVDGSSDISQTPAGFPVLLTWTDHDGFDASDTRFDPADEQANQTATTNMLKTQTSADINSWTQADAGHAIFLVATMPTWTAKVGSWLHSHGF